MRGADVARVARSHAAAGNGPTKAGDFADFCRLIAVVRDGLA